jgi:ABC-type microcin C transport system duplicated ATPase subunit YejF
VLTLRNVSAGFPFRRGVFSSTGFKTIVHNISFDIPRGTTLGLVGESGSGKTTIGRAILGLVPLSGGTIHVSLKNYGDSVVDPLSGQMEKRYGAREFDLTPGSWKGLRPLRQRMQIIFQDPYSSLNPRMRVSELMTEALAVHEPQLSQTDRIARCTRTLDRVGLSAAALNRYPHEFSGGQRQRISIARALVLEPEFIVCDECVSALDVSIQAQIINLLRELQTELGLTYLFISHDLAVVRHISSQVCVLSQGRIVEQGPAANVLRNPQNDYTRRLLAAVPSLIPSRV